jgi:hypothetical protein
LKRKGERGELNGENMDTRRIYQNERMAPERLHAVRDE